MAARGAKGLCLDMDHAALAETARLIAAEGGTCALVGADVSKAPDCAAAVAEAVGR
jgi:NAD(P)-dependent dehydrogenase (short-subunit alcohol dehydrogenase family)